MNGEGGGVGGVGQMNVEVSVSRTGRRLETDGFTHRLEARKRSGGRG